MFRRVPALQRLARGYIYWKRELFGAGFVLEPGILRLVQRLAVLYLEAKVKDPALRAKLRPSYAMGCKRVLPTNDYYPAMARDNVEIVTDGIAEIRPRSIVTKDGKERPVDVIVYATGFEAAEVKPP